MQKIDLLPSENGQYSSDRGPAPVLIVRINVPYERMMNGSMPFPGSTAVWDYDSLSHQW